MRSKTKLQLDTATVKTLFEAAGINGVYDIAPLGAGEFNAVFSAKAGGKEYAVKIAPTADAPILSYEKNIMSAEVFWYGEMRGKTSIRVPEVFYYDSSKSLIPAEWFIMEKINGVQLDKVKLSPREKQQVVADIAAMAAELHRVKGNLFGYVQCGLHPDWYSALRTMVEAIAEDAHKRGYRSKRTAKLLNCLDENKEILARADCCMVNYDIWEPNIICSRNEDGKISYTWIDPERSMWGDRMLDFVCLEATLPLKGKTTSLEAYNKVADKPVLCTREEQIRYAAGLGYYAAIMETEKYYRYTPLHFGWWRNVFASWFFYKKCFGIFDNVKRDPQRS